MRPAAEITLMERVKQALDPMGMRIRERFFETSSTGVPCGTLGGVEGG